MKRWLVIIDLCDILDGASRPDSGEITRELPPPMRSIPPKNAFIVRFVLATLLVSSAAATGSALTIISNYRKTGANLGGIGTAGAPSPNTIGGGDFADIFRAAVGVWESLILDDFTLTINFGWYPTEPISLTAYEQGTGVGGTPRRQTRGSIAFNNDNADGYRWFLDPTPLDNSEFGPLVTSRTDLGGGLINSRREHVPVIAETIGNIDLFSTALHEIGHALGLGGYDFFENEVADGDIDVMLAPFAGTVIPIDGPHIDLLGPSLSNRGRPVGYRREISDVDVLAVSQVSQFTQYVLSPQSDFDGDRDVDGDDLATWTAAYGPNNSADTDRDGDSDGNDFLNWQRGVGAGLDSGDLADWRTNIDFVNGLSSPAVSVIPEPAASISATLLALILTVLRKTASQNAPGRARTPSPDPWSHGGAMRVRGLYRASAHSQASRAV